MSPNSGWLIQRNQKVEIDYLIINLSYRKRGNSYHLFAESSLVKLQPQFFPYGSKLAHLYDLPKTHKKQLAKARCPNATGDMWTVY